jgi:iron complex outermembrane receptor protein
MSFRVRLFVLVALVATTSLAPGLGAPARAQDADPGASDALPEETKLEGVDTDAIEYETTAGPGPGDDEAEVDTFAGVEEITVTATKRAESIQDVPISITALSSGLIQDAGLTEFAQLQNFVPNLQILPTTDTRSTSIRIRGIGSVGNNAGIDPSVGIFIDGVYQGRAGMSVGDLLDIERVEVLRGPQGTLYGKNTAAGAINILTKKPNYEWSANGEAVVGNYNNLEFRGTVNAPIVQDSLALRLSGFKTGHEGFDRNLVTNNRVNDSNKYGFRTKMVWDISDRFYMMLSGDYQEENANRFVADIKSYNPQGPTLTGVTFGTMAAVPGAPPLPIADPFDRLVYADQKPKDIVKVGGAALEMDLDWLEHDFRWLNAWRTFESDSRFDGDFSQYDGVLAFQDVDLNQFSSELTIVSPAWDRFQYQGGLFFYYMNMETRDANGFREGLVAAGRLTRTDPGNAAWLIFFQPNENINTNEHETLSIASYAQGTYKFFDELSLTGGVRVTYEEKKREGISESTALIDAPPILGPTLYRNESRGVTNLQGTLILRYYPIDDVMIYGSFSNGFKSGGFNQLRVSRGVTSEFDDENSLNYEIGTKTSWFDRTLIANVTAYFTDYQDFQAQVFTGATIGVRNAGRLFAYGFESELQYVPSWIDNLTLGAAIALNVTEYKKFKVAENTVAGQTAIAAAADPTSKTPLLVCGRPGVNCNQDLTGRARENAPLWNITANAAYEYPLPKYPVDWFIRADYTYTSSYYLAQDLDPNLWEDGFHMLMLRSGFRAEDDLWEVTFWAKNLADQNYFITGFDVPVISGFAVQLGPPRQYGATFRVKF